MSDSRGEAPEDRAEAAARPSRRFARRTWIACACLGLAAGVVFSVMVKHPIGMILAPYVVLPAAFTVFLVARCFGLAPVDTRSDLVIPGLVLAAFLASREGLFGDTLCLDVNWHSTHMNCRWESNASTSGTSGFMSGPPLKGAEITVESASGWGPQIAGAVQDELDAVVWPVSAIKIEVKLDATDSWCFVPFYKSSAIDCRATITVSWQRPGASGTATIELSAKLDQSAWGVKSRRRFNQSFGSTLAEKIAKDVRDAID